jgi:hypothetical protein
MGVSNLDKTTQQEVGRPGFKPRVSRPGVGDLCNHANFPCDMWTCSFGGF